jgi:hypothetical protein
MKLAPRIDRPAPGREARGARGLAAAFGALACACSQPSYTLPDGAVQASVRLVQATPGAVVDVGNRASDLCVVQSITGWVSGSGAASADDGGSEASAADDTGAASTVGSQVNLFFDETGEWYLRSSGAVAATVACAPWGAFGGPQPMWRVDIGGANAVAPSVGAPAGVTPSADDPPECVLSDLEGDFAATGNGASIDRAGVLTVTNASGQPLYASETCFAGAPAVPYTDYVVDAADGSVSVPVASEGDALCGLSALSSLGQSQSGVVVARGRALGTSATSTVRCFFFVGPDAQ